MHVCISIHVFRCFASEFVPVFSVSAFQCLLCFESVSCARFIVSLVRLIHRHAHLVATLVSYFSVHPWVRICVCLSDRLQSCVPLSPCPFLCQLFYLNLCSCSCSVAQQLRTVSPLDLPTLLVATLQSWRGHLLQPECLKKSPKKINPSLRQSEERGQTKTQLPSVSPTGSNWPSLPTPTGSSSPIQPGQRIASLPSPSLTTPVNTWKVKQRDPEEYEKDRVGKYADYFIGYEILPIPEIMKKIEPWIVSLVITYLKTNRLVGLKKENFEDLLRTSGVPCQYFCCKSFATWDILMPTEEQAVKVATNNITTKFFRLQLEYMSTCRI